MSDDYIRGYLAGLRTLYAWIEEEGAAESGPTLAQVKAEIESMCEIMCK